jgi:hypothetical protein
MGLAARSSVDVIGSLLAGASPPRLICSRCGDVMRNFTVEYIGSRYIMMFMFKPGRKTPSVRETL